MHPYTTSGRVELFFNFSWNLAVFHGIFRNFTLIHIGKKRGEEGGGAGVHKNQENPKSVKMGSNIPKLS